MPTKKYLTSTALTAPSGTLPSGEQDSQSPSFSASTAATIKGVTAAAGSAMASMAGTTLANTSPQAGFMGMWGLPPLSGAQTIGGASETVTVNVADLQSNLAANFCVNRAHVYVWRPSTGTVVGDCCTYATAPSGGSPTEATSASSIQVTSFVVDLASVSASDGDVIIVELWASFTQDTAAAYTASIYYEGSTEQTVENTVVSDHAAYVEFSQNLTFQSVPARLTSELATTIYADTGATPTARLTAELATTIYADTGVIPAARLTGQLAYVIYEINTAAAYVTSVQAEILSQESSAPLARVTALQLEVISSNKDIKKRPRTFVST